MTTGHWEGPARRRPTSGRSGRLVREAVSAYGEDAASITREREYHDAAGMYFTEVEPARTGAASVSLGCDGCWGGDTILVTFGHTSFEVFPFRDDSDLAYLRQLVDAVLAGRVEEAGWKHDSFARLHTGGGMVVVGAFHLPIPWGLSRVRRYLAYAEHGR